MDFDGEVSVAGHKIKVSCLKDTGASAKAFVDQGFIKRYKISSLPLIKPCKLRMADDRLSSYITRMAQVRLYLGDHIEDLWCLVTPLGKFDVILGMPWLELHDPIPSYK